MAIYVYNRKLEDYTNKINNYPIYSRKLLLGNPYSNRPEDTKGVQSVFRVRNRQEAIDRYSSYFDMEYTRNERFRSIIDDIYLKYKDGEDIYFECQCKHHKIKDQNDYPEDIGCCHGDIIRAKLEKRLIKEKIKELENGEQMG